MKINDLLVNTQPTPVSNNPGFEDWLMVPDPQTGEYVPAIELKVKVAQLQGHANQAVAKTNLKSRGEFTRGVLRGTDQLQGSLYGMAGLLGSLSGLEGLKDWGFEGYKRNMDEAALNPASVEFDDLSFTEPGKIATWAVGTLGELAPSMAEAVVTGAAGAVAGSAAAGVGAVPGAAMGFFGKRAARKLIEDAASSYVAKGFSRELAETLAQKEVAAVAKSAIEKQAMKVAGAKAGLVAGVLPMEAGGNWGEVLQERGVDNPISALATGTVSAFMELAGGNSRLIGKVLGPAKEKSFMKAIQAGDTKLVARIGKEAMISGAGEFAQEAGQEFSSMVNVAVNDPTFEIFTEEGVKRMVEAGAAGFVGGFAGGHVSGYTGWKADTDAESRKKAVGEFADQSGMTPYILAQHKEGAPVDDIYNTIATSLDEHNASLPDEKKITYTAGGIMDTIDTVLERERQANAPKKEDAKTRMLRAFGMKPKQGTGNAPMADPTTLGKDIAQGETRTADAMSKEETARQAAEMTAQAGNIAGADGGNLLTGGQEQEQAPVALDDLIDSDLSADQAAAEQATLAARQEEQQAAIAAAVEAKLLQQTQGKLIVNGAETSPEAFQGSLLGLAAELDKNRKKLEGLSLRDPLRKQTEQQVRDQANQLRDLQAQGALWEKSNPDQLADYVRRQEAVTQAQPGDLVVAAGQERPLTIKAVRPQGIFTEEFPQLALPPASLQVYPETPEEKLARMTTKVQEKERLRLIQDIAKREKDLARRAGFKGTPAYNIEAAALEAARNKLATLEAGVLPMDQVGATGTNAPTVTAKAPAPVSETSQPSSAATIVESAPTSQAAPERAANADVPASPALAMLGVRPVRKSGRTEATAERPFAQTNIGALVLDNMRSELQSGSGKGLNEQDGEYTRIPSSYPGWFKAIVSRWNDPRTSPSGKKEGIGAKDGITVINKVKNGETLTERQRLIWNDMLSAAEAHARQPHYQAAGREMDLAEQGFVPVNPEATSIIDLPELKRGDQVILANETEPFTVLGRDPEGNTVFSRGAGRNIETRTADEFTPLSEMPVAYLRQARRDQSSQVTVPSPAATVPAASVSPDSAPGSQSLAMLGVQPVKTKADTVVSGVIPAFAPGDRVEIDVGDGESRLGTVEKTNDLLMKQGVINVRYDGDSHTSTPLIEYLKKSDKPGLMKHSEGSETAGSLTVEFKKLLQAGEQVTRQQVLAATAAASGKASIADLQKDPGFNPKKMEEEFELAVVLQARDILNDNDNYNKEDERWTAVKDLYEKQPNLSTRTSTSIANQQYSTPAPLAYLMNKHLGLDGKSALTVFEPTAGNGMLVIGANAPRRVTVNELDKNRAERLRRLGGNVYNEDILGFFDNHPEMEATQDRVTMNPPFGTAPETKQYDGFPISKLEHQIAIEGLRAMADDGKAAFIIGGHNFSRSRTAVPGTQPTARMTETDRLFFNYLYSHYNVTHNIDISGDVYRKMGTTFPIRLITIEGRKTTPDQTYAPRQAQVESAQTFDEVKEILDNSKNNATLTSTEGENAGATTPTGQQAPAKPDRVPGEGDQRLPGGKTSGLASPGKQSGRSGAAADEGVGPGTGNLSAVRTEPHGTGRPYDDRGGLGQPEVQPAGMAPAGESGGSTRPGSDRGSLRRSITDEINNLSLDDISSLFDEAASEVTANQPPTAGQQATPPTKQEQIAKTEPVVKKPLIPGSRPLTRPKPVTERAAAAPQNIIPESKTTTPEGAKTAAEIAAAAAQHGVKGAGEAIAGLYDLFGGNALKSFPGAVDPATYAKAKPHFQKAYDEFKQAGKSLKEFMGFIVQQFNANVKPYLMQFIQDLKTVITGGSYQESYIPRSAAAPGNNYVPRSMAKAISTALDIVEAKHGSIDDYVQKELQYPDRDALYRAFSAEQLDALALTIDNIQSGSGMIIGDQTGVGKGRVIAGIIRWANLNGMKPIFFTEKTKLFTDMYRDLMDINHRITPFIMHADPEAAIVDNDGRTVHRPSGGTRVYDRMLHIPEGAFTGYDAVFATYSQINVPNRQQRILINHAIGNVVILDESHNAAGAVSNTGVFIRQGILQHARAVLYSSATFAKRPDTMPLYFRTGMSDAGMTIEDLIAAVQNGGTALQEYLADALARMGQYVRRELNYSGVNFQTKIDFANEQRDVATADGHTQGLRAILEFDRAKQDYVATLSDQAGESGQTITANTGISAGVTSINFASTVHNFASQLLFAIKADTAAAEAVMALKEGRKPVITMMNTMESAIDHAAREGMVGIGDPIGHSFTDVLNKALSGTLKITTTDAYGNKRISKLNPDDFPPPLRALWDEAVRVIAGIRSDLPASPIDYIKAQIQKAGYTVGEITGRSLYIDYTEKIPVLRARTGKEIHDRNTPVLQFNNGQIDAMIFNAAGSTGISLHASEKVKDQRPRRMIIAQPQLNIDTFMQALGRIFRKGQVNTPEYVLLQTALPAEIRPANVLQKKMSSLNANTTASTETDNTLRDIPDMMNSYGDQVTHAYLSENHELADILRIDADTPEAYKKATGRLAVMPVAVQREFFEEIEEAYKSHIDYLNQVGENNLVTQEYDFGARTLARSKIADGTENAARPLAGPAWLERVSVKILKRPFRREKVQEMCNNTLQGVSRETYARALLQKITTATKEYLETQGEDFPEHRHALVDRQLAEAGELLNRFLIGSSFHLEPAPGYGMVSVLTGVHWAAGKQGSPAAPSKMKFTFALAAPMQVISLPASNDMLRNAVRYETHIPDDWDEMLPTTQREDRYIITGNLLQGYDRISSRAEMVFYTDETGGRKRGILIPRQHQNDIARNLAGSSAAAVDAYNHLVGGDNRQIQTTNGEVTIRNLRPGEYLVEVPKSRKAGGKYFENAEVLALVQGGEFVSRGNKMTSRVNGQRNIKGVLEAFERSTNVRYIIPSEWEQLAEEPASGLLTDALYDDNIMVKEQQRFFAASDEAVQQIKESSDEKRKISAPGGKSQAPDSGRRAGAVELRQEVVSARETYIKTGTDRVRNIGDAANVARYLADYAQEQAILIVTDKNDKVLAILKHTQGLKSQSQVDPVAVAGQALNVKKATKAWFVHNHPSGVASASDADKNITSVIKNLFRGTRVDLAGSLIVTPAQYVDVATDEAFNMDSPGGKDVKIPVLERKFSQRGINTLSIDSARYFVSYAKANKLPPGIALLDGQNVLVGFVPEAFNLFHRDYTTIRGPLQESILREADRRNATAFLVYAPDREVSSQELRNLERFARASKGGLYFQDLIDNRPYSAQEEGRIQTATATNANFYSVETQGPGVDKIRQRSLFYEPLFRFKKGKDGKTVPGIIPYEKRMAAERRANTAATAGVETGARKVPGYIRNDKRVARTREEVLANYREEISHRIDVDNEMEWDDYDNVKLSEIIDTVESELKAGKNPSEIFNALKKEIKKAWATDIDADTYGNENRYRFVETLEKNFNELDKKSSTSTVLSVQSDIAGTANQTGNVRDLVRQLAATVKGVKVEERDDGRIFIRTKSGQTVEVTSVEQITADKVTLSVAYGTETLPEGKVIAGRYAGGEGTKRIDLVKDKAGIYTLSHEFYHFLEDIAAVSAADMDLIRKKIRYLHSQGKLGFTPRKAGVVGSAEDRATWMGKQLSGQYDAKTPIGKILQKIRDIIDQVVNAVGVRTASGVVRDIKSGKIYNARPGQPAYPGLTVPETQPKYMVAAWHGGRPLEGGKFSTDFIGSGEGNQSFGWGLYFSDLKSIGSHYAEKARGDVEPALWREFQKANPALAREFKSEIEIAASRSCSDGVLGIELENVRWFSKNNQPQRYISEELAKEILPLIPAKTPRNLYRVSLHKGKEPGQYNWLEWDKPLSKQSEKTKKALMDAGYIIEENTYPSLKQAGTLFRSYRVQNDAWSDIGIRETLREGAKIMQSGDVDAFHEWFDEHGGLLSPGRKKDIIGGDFYHKLSSGTNGGYGPGPQGASMYLLNKLGIDGIKYPAGTLTGGKTGGFNYVVFDPAAVTVEEHIQYSLEDLPADTAENLKKFAADQAEAKNGAVVNQSIGKQAEAAWARAFEKGVGTTSRAVDMIAGKRITNEQKEGWDNFKQHWREFWSPFSTVPEGEKALTGRYKAMGDIARATQFLEGLHAKIDAFPDDVKKSMFQYLDGQIPIDYLPDEARGLAESIRQRTRSIGQALVERGILAENQFKAYEGRYIHYMYAKHVLGEDAPVGITGTGKLNPTYTISRNPKMTMQQRKALGLIEDASVAVPVGMGKALTDIAKWDYLAAIAENDSWVWQPSLVKLPLGKVKKDGTRRMIKMGIGKLVEEVKIYEKMMATHPSPEVEAHYRILKDGLDRAMEDTANVPDDFQQLPNSKAYGPLAGAYVLKPIADDLRPIISISADSGRLFRTLAEISTTGMAGFKIGKVALNFPTAVRNIVSNIIQNNMRGRALSKIPGDIVSALESMKVEDKLYKEAFGMGLFKTNWFAVEINEVLDAFRGIASPEQSWTEIGRSIKKDATLPAPITMDKIIGAIKKVAKYYGKIDDVSKFAIYKQMRNDGAGIEEATLEAMKWGMDYSLTSRSVKGLRQTFMPFVTYQYKIAPLIAESLIKRPWVIGKYMLIWPLAKAAAMGFNDLDDDDWDDLMKQLPSYVKNTGSVMILPWKTDKGQWQWINLEYFFPWGNYAGIFRDVREADLGEFTRDAGISNPFMDIARIALSARGNEPPEHPYTGQPIWNRLDNAPVKAAKFVEALANIWTPSMITRQGALGYTVKAGMGGEDRWGREATAAQALGRWFGLNVTAVSPEQTRAQAAVKIQEFQKEMARVRSDQTYTEEEKQAKETRLRKELAEIAEESPTAVLPINKAKGKDPVYDALQEMVKAGTLHTGPPSRTVEIAGISQAMNMARYREYLDKSSELARPRLQSLFESEGWVQMTDKRRGEVVGAIVSNARKGVRQRIKVEMMKERREKAPQAAAGG